MKPADARFNASPEVLAADNVVQGNRECALIRVFGGQGTYRGTLDHPSAAETENAVESGAERRHFRVRCRCHIWTAKRPCGQKRAILLEKDAVTDKRVVQKKVSKSLCAGAM